LYDNDHRIFSVYPVISTIYPSKVTPEFIECSQKVHRASIEGQTFRYRSCKIFSEYAFEGFRKYRDNSFQKHSTSSEHHRTISVAEFIAEGRMASGNVMNIHRNSLQAQASMLEVGRKWSYSE